MTMNNLYLCEAIVGCKEALRKSAERQKHSVRLEAIFCLSMQTKIRGMKSPVSCAGLDRITIKGRAEEGAHPLCCKQNE